MNYEQKFVDAETSVYKAINEYIINASVEFLRGRAWEEGNEPDLFEGSVCQSNLLCTIRESIMMEDDPSWFGSYMNLDGGYDTRTEKSFHDFLSKDNVDIEPWSSEFVLSYVYLTFMTILSRVENELKCKISGYYNSRIVQQKLKDYIYARYHLWLVHSQEELVKAANE